MKKCPLHPSVLLCSLLLATSLSQAISPAVLKPEKAWKRVWCFGDQQTELTMQQQQVLILELGPAADLAADTLRRRAIVGAGVARVEELTRGREVAELVAEHLERTLSFDVRTGYGWNPLIVRPWVRPIRSAETIIQNPACAPNEKEIEISVNVYAPLRK